MSIGFPFKKISSGGDYVPLRRLKVAILKFSLMYLINNVHVAASGIHLPIPLKPAASSNLFIYRLEEVAGFRFRGIGSSISLSFKIACISIIAVCRSGRGSGSFKIATFSRLSGTY